jgi:hypothetical protein
MNNIFATPQGKTIVGIDMGNGYCKVYGGGQYGQPAFHSFRAIYGRQYRSLEKSLSEERREIMLPEDPAGSFLVGDFAEQILGRNNVQRMDGEIKSQLKGFKILYYAALADVLKPATYNDVMVVSGLPVETAYDDQKKQDYRNALKGEHHFSTPEGEYHLNVTEVPLMPQPQGTIWGLGINDQGQTVMHNDGTSINIYSDKITVLDFGSGTTDIQTRERGQDAVFRSGSLNRGINEVYDRFVSAQYQGRYASVPLKVLESQIFTENRMPAAQAAVDSVWEEIRDFAIQKIQEGDFGEVFVLTGGGVPLFQPKIEAGGLFPQHQIMQQKIRSVEKPHTFGNARGFYRFGKMRALKNG